MIERIDETTPPSDTVGHLARYQLASAFVDHGNTVIDAACGTGYGAPILQRLAVDARYVGVDRYDGLPEPAINRRRDFIQADLTTWEPDRPFDVFVGFETIEHLADYNHYIRIAQQARKWIIVSAPIIPSKHVNPFHLHDFEPGDLQALFESEEWGHYQTFGQPSEVSEIVILRRMP